MTKPPTVSHVARCYERGLQFNTELGLYDTVTKNENFFIGKTVGGRRIQRPAHAGFQLFKARGPLPGGHRHLRQHRHAGVAPGVHLPSSTSGTSTRWPTSSTSSLPPSSSAISWWGFCGNTCATPLSTATAVSTPGLTPPSKTAQNVKGEIVTEVVENTRVHFGNPNSRDVQTQPYILLCRRMMVDEAQQLAKDSGSPDWEAIGPDHEDFHSPHDAMTDDKVTVLTYLYRDRKTGTIWKYLCTQSVEMARATDTGLTLYPIVWLNWGLCPGTATTARP